MGTMVSPGSRSADNATAVYNAHPYFSNRSPVWVTIWSRGIGPSTTTFRLPRGWSAVGGIVVARVSRSALHRVRDEDVTRRSLGHIRRDRPEQPAGQGVDSAVAHDDEVRRTFLGRGQQSLTGVALDQ